LPGWVCSSGSNALCAPSAFLIDGTDRGCDANRSDADRKPPGQKIKKPDNVRLSSKHVLHAAMLQLYEDLFHANQVGSHWQPPYAETNAYRIYQAKHHQVDEFMPFGHARSCFFFYIANLF
jgi:hypothetical protein